VNDFPNTNANLIARIKDPGNAAAWESFEQIYRPVVFRIARARGLQYADAVDLVQQVFISVAHAIDSYERKEGGPPFRNWLSRITRNAVLKALTRQPKDRASGGTAILEVLSEVPSVDQATVSLLQDELRLEVFKQAAEKVRGDVEPLTWLAFEMSVLQQQSVNSVSTTLNLSPGNIYAARSRVMKRLKEAVRNIEFGSSDQLHLEQR
jgi:RNA polymerase sigma-70 factor (ECF subfamily)